MKINLRSQKGIVASDALLAIVLIVLFSTLILAISFNIFMSNSSLKRMSEATNYITSVFEYVDKQYYDDVNQSTLETYCRTLDTKGINVNPSEGTWDGKGYKIDVSVQSYVPENAVSATPDLVKEIEMSVTYRLSGKEQNITMTRIKKREKLETPNKPDFSLITLQENEKIYPVKKVNDIWKITNDIDSNWYNYNNGIWAVVIVTDDIFEIGDTVDLSEYNPLVWIPRYAFKNLYGEEEMYYKFTYQTTDNYVTQSQEGYNILEAVDKNEYVMHPTEKVQGSWREKSDVQNELLSLVLQMKNI